MSRRPFIAGNWKMHKTASEAAAFVSAFAAGVPDGVDVAVCPPFTALAAAVEAARATPVAVYAQNMHQAESGAFTGEVSAGMLLDAGVDGVLLGHSERRQLFCETDEALQRKLAAALAAGLEPVLCVGETELERDDGKTEERLRIQVESALAGVDASGALQLTIAYEPVWAIGTGKTATPQIAQTAHAFIRHLLIRNLGDEAAAAIRILYGGSVKPDNARELLDQPDVDGALVGGASLDPASFAAIARAGLPG
jgi:triosephosphate isomerase